MLSLKENITILRQKISEAAAKSGRKPEDICLIAVTKTIPVDVIQQAVNLGINFLGENRVQEAKSKVDLVTGDVQWHLIGHLQRNKVKAAVKIFSMIQSVDSLELGEEINKRASQIDKVMDILIQINIGNEPQKSGIEVQKAPELIKDLAKLPNLRIKGLMAIPPLIEDLEKIRPYFRKMKQLFDDIARQNIDNVEMRYLSMGMTNDFTVAIEEGANMIRVGTGIFGKRINN
mgnify:CR=1 FL=1